MSETDKTSNVAASAASSGAAQGTQAQLPEWAQLFRARSALSDRSAPDDLPPPPPVRLVSGHYFRQVGRKRTGPLDVLESAPSAGRYHRRGWDAPAYSSSTEEASWGELFRHTEPGISPFEVKRTMYEIEVTELRVLDLTDPTIRDALGVTERNLTSNRLTVCHQIAAFVRNWREDFDGILAPSVAVPGMETLVIFREGFSKVRVIKKKDTRPPARLVYLFERIIETLPPSQRDALRELARELRNEFRRRTGL